ncbi:MAG: alkaline phosphatase family protein [Anaerolineae bacterium]|nr:MAG: alkaline phosphatase family protein [Anaerolineae bacterium]
MSTTLESTLKRIEEHRLPDLDLGPEAIHPAYDGLSILNVPASIANWLGAPGFPHPPIDHAEFDDLASSARQVVVILVDALGLNLFECWLEGRAKSLQPLVSRGALGALTSVVPSTTSAALTTLWTGRSPAEHGILGYELFLREYGLVANMITHAPASFEGEADSLVHAGFDPKSFLPVQTMGPHLSEAGVESHAFLHSNIAGSGLSTMHYPEVNQHSFDELSDLWTSLRQLLDTASEKPRFIWSYFGNVDHLAHRHGPHDERVEAEFAQFADSLMAGFVDALSPEARKDTVLILMADHGQVATRKDPHLELRNHPDLIRRLHMLPSGENRLAYLYPRPGQADAVEEYIARTWPRMFRILGSDHALAAGLFGPGQPSKSARSRIGDRVALSQGEGYLWWAAKENPLLGRHGSVTSEEMLVPFLMVRLDA